MYKEIFFSSVEGGIRAAAMSVPLFVWLECEFEPWLLAPVVLGWWFMCGVVAERHLRKMVRKRK
ncbi:MAG: hypothetical protein LBL52_01180 [Rickettsiales bacterium]|jgi:hypothetical protein|nr:hypothetical protein [Rickettsiales bacterium]